MDINAVLFAYRTTKHCSTGVTPFMMLYGREARLLVEHYPADGNVADTDEGLSGYSNDEEEEELTVADRGHLRAVQKESERMLAIQKEVHELASKNITRAQQRQKKNFDARNAPPAHKVGSLVLLRNSRQDTRKGGKLRPAWSGPHKVKEVTGKGLVKLHDVSKQKTMKRAVNPSRLKPVRGDSSLKVQHISNQEAMKHAV